MRFLGHLNHNGSHVWQLLSNNFRSRSKLLYAPCHFGSNGATRQELNRQQRDFYRSIRSCGNIDRSPIFRPHGGFHLNLLLTMLFYIHRVLLNK